MNGKAFLEKHGAEAFIATDENTMRYLLGYAAEGYVLLTEAGMTLFTDSRYTEEAKARLHGRANVCEIAPHTAQETLANVLQNCKRVGYEADRITAAQFAKLLRFDKDFIDLSGAVWQEAAVKTAEEIACIARACAITEQAFLETLPRIRAGMTEQDLAAEIEYRMKKKGASGLAFDTIAAFGANAAVPHHVPNGTRLTKNTAVLVDCGARYGGYCGDMTRTVFFGTPDDTFLQAYDLVYNAHLAGAKAARAGATAKSADAAAREIIDSSAFSGTFTHSLGHGVGINIHELPVLSPRSQAVFEENNVFTVEPGIYQNGAFGIRIEDTYRIEKGVAVSFMTGDKRLTVL